MRTEYPIITEIKRYRYICVMAELISVSDAARELDRDPSRVRALVASGLLPGAKIGNSWVVDRIAVARRKRDQPGSGRPFEPHNAWAVLLLASGCEVYWLDAGSLWRLRNALSLHGLMELGPRLQNRAVVHHLHCHPGELRYLAEDPALVRTGISAAGKHGLGLVSGPEVDGYVRAGDLEGLERGHALLPAAERAEANVAIRAVRDSAWHLDGAGSVAPIAAVALDLAEDPDPRSTRIGVRALRDVDLERKRRLG